MAVPVVDPALTSKSTDAAPRGPSRVASPVGPKRATGAATTSALADDDEADDAFDADGGLPAKDRRLARLRSERLRGGRTLPSPRMFAPWVSWFYFSPRASVFFFFVQPPTYTTSLFQHVCLFTSVLRPSHLARAGRLSIRLV